MKYKCIENSPPFIKGRTYTFHYNPIYPSTYYCPNSINGIGYSFGANLFIQCFKITPEFKFGK